MEKSIRITWMPNDGEIGGDRGTSSSCVKGGMLSSIRESGRTKAFSLQYGGKVQLETVPYTELTAQTSSNMTYKPVWYTLQTHPLRRSNPSHFERPISAHIKRVPGQS